MNYTVYKQKDKVIYLKDKLPSLCKANIQTSSGYLIPDGVAQIHSSVTGRGNN